MRARSLVSVSTLALLAACSGSNPQSTALASAVRIEAVGCGQETTLAGGSFIASHRVVTVAHAIAGSARVSVTSADGKRHDAEVVGIDRRKDLALLAVPGVDQPVLPAATMRVDDVGTFVAFRDGRPRLTSFTARRKVGIKIDSIDEDVVVLRSGYQIEAEIDNGDSGAVLVVNGSATAVLFARSRGLDNRAWATDISELDPLLAADTGQPVDRGACSEFS
jgi:hypothetical protein